MQEISFPKAVMAFLDDLRAHYKSLHTIKSYRLDLEAFQHFLESHFASKNSILLKNFDEFLLEAFKQKLLQENSSSNTQRRKILTISVFFRFCVAQKWLPEELGAKTLTPRKKEFIPHTVPWVSLNDAIHLLPVVDAIQLRNKIILHILAESACLVSELCEIRWEDWSFEPQQAWLQVRGKSPRELRISKKLEEYILIYAKMLGSEYQHMQGWMFVGATVAADHNMAMTPRAIEMIIKHLTGHLKLLNLTPRVIRHSRAFYWLQQGMSPNTLKDVLGLKTHYGLKGYLTLYKLVEDKALL